MLVTPFVTRSHSHASRNAPWIHVSLVRPVTKQAVNANRPTVLVKIRLSVMAMLSGRYGTPFVASVRNASQTRIATLQPAKSARPAVRASRVSKLVTQQHQAPVVAEHLIASTTAAFSVLELPIVLQASFALKAPVAYRPTAPSTLPFVLQERPARMAIARPTQAAESAIQPTLRDAHLEHSAIHRP